MCKFFSAISDGLGKTLFFKVEDVAKILAEGNDKQYGFNSHTSIADYYGLTPEQEDMYNKWEYNNGELIQDQLNTTDDRDSVLLAIESYLSGKNKLFLIDLYNYNAGCYNAGDRNAGHGNAGSGNAGHGNAGYHNSGSYNSGNGNSGSYNAGHGNAGYYNAGSYNAGHGNAGSYNSGNGVKTFFCTKTYYVMFNQKCDAEDINVIKNIDFSWFLLNEWVCFDKMTDEEKEANPNSKILNGCLKTVSYKDAWAKCPDKILAQIKKLRNFDPVIFKDITGIDIGIDTD